LPTNVKSATNGVAASALVTSRVSANPGTELKRFADSVQVQREAKSMTRNVAGDVAAARSKDTNLPTHVAANATPTQRTETSATDGSS